MNADEISEMIRRVTRRRISPSTIRSTAAGMVCKGVRDRHGVKYFNSEEIGKILWYHELNPAAFVGRG